MTRVAVYARYSSELQQDRSIDDQLALCRDYAARRNWTVTRTYADRAISGASIHGRHEFQRMVEDAKDGLFDLVLAEDRYGSRHRRSSSYSSIIHAGRKEYTGRVADLFEQRK